MLVPIPFTLSTKLINRALDQLPADDFRYTINQPTGDFFYDTWELRPELKGTIWDSIYNSISYPKGEARIIRLNGNESYYSHADIDDRYHLNLTGDKCYLIDLDRDIMYPVTTDGVWYEMNAGIRHSAANFSNRPRLQLVIRKPLVRGTFVPTHVTITAKPEVDAEDARFLFDDVLSPWLNKINKEGLLDNFKFNQGYVTFDLDYWTVPLLKELLPKEFNLTLV